MEPAPMHRQRFAVCAGMTAEIAFVVTRRPFESHYCGPLHLLIAHECLVRSRGATTVEGAPPSNLQNLSRTLTFVPAGCRFREWHEPDIPSHAIYIHIDPHCALMTAGQRAGTSKLGPRVHFQNTFLWQTVQKFKSLSEEGRSANTRYADALGVVLAHELLRSHMGAAVAPTTARGGLTAWQQRIVVQYVDANLTERIPLQKLAALAALSQYHFCRSFKHSFGTSPHRYHSLRKVERAKELLADRRVSITDVALGIGFCDASAFTTTFRKLVGQTPTTYRRSLAHEGG